MNEYTYMERVHTSRVSILANIIKIFLKLHIFEIYNFETNIEKYTYMQIQC